MSHFEAEPGIGSEWRKRKESRISIKSYTNWIPDRQHGARLIFLSWWPLEVLQQNIWRTVSQLGLTGCVLICHNVIIFRVVLIGWRSCELQRRLRWKVMLYFPLNAKITQLFGDIRWFKNFFEMSGSSPWVWGPETASSGRVGETLVI